MSGDSLFRVALGDEKYVLLTTFRRDGTPVATPVWVVTLAGGRLGFYTSSGSGKAKRLAHTARVTVHPCDARGRVKAGSVATDATARLVTGSEWEAIRERVIAKYGFATKITRLLGTVGGVLRGKRIPHGDRGRVPGRTPCSRVERRHSHRERQTAAGEQRETTRRHRRRLGAHPRDQLPLEIVPRMTAQDLFDVRRGHVPHA